MNTQAPRALLTRPLAIAATAAAVCTINVEAALASPAHVASRVQRDRAARPTARQRGWKWVLSIPVHYVRAGGVKFAYRSIGAGPPLLLIDGLEATMSNQWDPAGLASIAGEHRVIIYDHRGVGLSRGDLSQMSIAELADDAARLIRALHITASDVWGQSMGACVAEELAIRHPSVVRRLVLTGGSAGSNHTVLGKLAPPGDAAAILKLVFTPDAAGHAAMRGFKKRTALWRPRESITPTARTAEYEAIAPFLFIPGAGAWEQLPRIQARVLIASGRRDVVNPPINAWILVQRMSHAIVELFPSAHFFYVQDQAQFIPALLRFLRGA